MNVDAARAFYKSVANLLKKEGIANFDMAEVEPDTVLIEDPFRIVTTLWEVRPSLLTHTHHTRHHLHAV